MPPSSNLQNYPPMALIGKLLAASILWVVALVYCGFETQAAPVSTAQDRAFASWDIPMYARGEMHARAAQDIDGEPQADTLFLVWVLLDPLDNIPVINNHAVASAQHRQHIYLQQLQGLDSPRAPPLV